MTFLVDKIICLKFFFFYSPLTFAKKCLVIISKSLINQFVKHMCTKLERLFLCAEIYFWPWVRSKEGWQSNFCISTSSQLLCLANHRAVRSTSASRSCPAGTTFPVDCFPQCGWSGLCGTRQVVPVGCWFWSGA